ncbi:MAG TPA: hypothetical protein VFJ19_03630 [Nocardioidaceae bacterium]|nr:hypothetical protein [Nocardioidaceae bacterium]
MTARRSARVALAFVVVLVALHVASFWLLALNGAGTTDPLWVEAGNRASFLATALLGPFLLWRRPENRVGLVLCVLAVGFPLEDVADSYATFTLRTAPGALPGGAYAGWVANWAWLVTYGAIPVVFLLFPDGRLPGRRWRFVAWFAVLDAGLFAVLSALAGGGLGDFPNVANPFGLLPVVIADLQPLVLLPAIAVLAAVLSLVVRFRRSRGEQRQQLKWVALAVALFGAYIVATSARAALGLPPDLMDVLGIAVPTAIPVAIALAILRYRLYDIDRLVSRTVSYAVVTGLLVSVYVGCVGLLTGVLPFGGTVGTAASVLVALALFAPLRRRVQDAVDRRFNRSRYDAAAVVEQFAAALRDHVDLDAVRSDLLGAVHRTVAPATATLWLRSAS